MSAKTTSEEMVNLAVEAAEEKKAYDVRVLDISGVSIISDYFMICSGNNVHQVQAVADNVIEKMEEKGFFVLRKEGMREGQWILLDYGDVVVHVFREQERQYYNLERLWAGAVRVGQEAELDKPDGSPSVEPEEQQV